MDGSNGRTCVHACSDGVTPVSTLPGLAGIAGLAGAGIADAAPASADAMDDGGAGHLLPATDAAAVAAEPGPIAVNLGT